MNKSNLNREWNFIVREINASNKGGTWKGKMLFKLQILLTAISRTRNQKEKLMLASAFDGYKKKYIEARA